MSDADAAVAAAQKLADQFAEQGDNGTNGTNAAVAVNGNGAEVKAEPELEELAGNKRKLDESEADESARKKASTSCCLITVPRPCVSAWNHLIAFFGYYNSILEELRGFCSS